MNKKGEDLKEGVSEAGLEMEQEEAMAVEWRVLAV